MTSGSSSPAAGALSKDEYLGLIASGKIPYLLCEPMTVLDLETAEEDARRRATTKRLDRERGLLVPITDPDRSGSSS
jgi:hypothetical protein